jgi:transcriptional regulator with XRE-family HTH domain
MPIEDFSKKQLGKRVAEIRGKLKQKEFAEIIGVSRSYVGNIEQGITMPSLEVLMKICHQYHVSLDYIVYGTKSSQQTSESNSDLEEMIDVLTRLIKTNNPDLIGWTKVQFQKTFGEYY